MPFLLKSAIGSSSDGANLLRHTAIKIAC